MRLGTWKRLAIFALVGLLLSLMISCSPGSNSGTRSDGRTQIEFWTMQLQPKFTDYFNELIQEFETENPTVAVRWVDVPWGAMESRILTAVSARTAPDVVNLNPDFASQLAGREAWLPLDDRVSPEVKAQYLPKIWQANTLNGQSFGVPWYLTSRIAIYNQALFEQAGISTPPQTYEELATVAKAIKEQTGNYAFFVTAVPEDSGEVMESLVQMGTTLVDEQGKAAFNTPEGRAAFQYWVDLYQQNLIPPQVLTEGHRHAVELYQSGQTALLSSSPEFLNTVATNAPDIARVSAAAPQLTGATGKKNVAVMNLVIPKDTEHPDEALEFALFVTNPENQLAFAKAANVLPSTQGSLEDPYFSTVSENASAADRARIVSAGQMQAAEVLIPSVKDVKQLQKILYENLQAAMLRQKTVEQAVLDAETAWNAAQA
ncbi:extracellular solute-binding protein [Synechococcales cyanobacterium C]|uniref:Extracellular solute-binding protein n=1 Tax=Petrachloros mirabilis ULC683 TaxID=2781853 RepID=A0A8K2A7Z3_9CYAN|nr:sugar ABC transporter substrate-binding protein [Petrachloros mirabilis]NCJ07444.1 extracellular solute-binding protein [Petrachloros mirabilis ULC683]